MRWTTHEIEYLEEHAGDGAKSIADELGRSSAAVEMQAYRYGISLRRWWLCPRCGRRTSRPLSSRTGWCSVCTMSTRRERMAEEVRDVQEESRRIEEERKARQALYARKSRAKKRAKQMKEK